MYIIYLTYTKKHIRFLASDGYINFTIMYEGVFLKLFFLSVIIVKNTLRENESIWYFLK